MRCPVKGGGTPNLWGELSASIGVFAGLGGGGGPFDTTGAGARLGGG